MGKNIGRYFKPKSKAEQRANKAKILNRIRSVNRLQTEESRESMPGAWPDDMAGSSKPHEDSHAAMAPSPRRENLTELPEKSRQGRPTAAGEIEAEAEKPTWKFSTDITNGIIIDNIDDLITETLDKVTADFIGQIGASILRRIPARTDGEITTEFTNTIIAKYISRITENNVAKCRHDLSVELADKLPNATDKKSISEIIALAINAVINHIVVDITNEFVLETSGTSTPTRTVSSENWADKGKQTVLSQDTSEQQASETQTTSDTQSILSDITAQQNLVYDQIMAAKSEGLMPSASTSDPAAVEPKGKEPLYPIADSDDESVTEKMAKLSVEPGDSTSKAMGGKENGAVKAADDLTSPTMSSISEQLFTPPPSSESAADDIVRAPTPGPAPKTVPTKPEVDQPPPAAQATAADPFDPGLGMTPDTGRNRGRLDHPIAARIRAFCERNVWIDPYPPGTQGYRPNNLNATSARLSSFDRDNGDGTAGEFGELDGPTARMLRFLGQEVYGSLNDIYSADSTTAERDSNTTAANGDGTTTAEGEATEAPKKRKKKAKGNRKKKGKGKTKETEPACAEEPAKEKELTNE